ncbi:hypothetical protein B0H16DRAFT_273091 [Mycena metata]|uniref:Zn(2)-C6 fungal-type domain-containing protein n=1 Tax=Mycena metata TaxID=1033252 RepID=A0AAD7JRY3_9AGAR|nr:hypothetical protein B0H16DRAFT_273091 [Mycena metata]
MSSSTAAGQNPQRPAPSFPRRRRALIACSHCRTRKLRCISAEQPPKAPCTRCQKHNLTCEYVSTEHDTSSTSSQSPKFVYWDVPDSPPASISPHQSDFAYRAPPPLPYTRPPPPNHRPRYSGTHYPDLSTAPQHEVGTVGTPSPPVPGASYFSGASHPRPHPSATLPAEPNYSMQPAQPYSHAPASLQGTHPCVFTPMPDFTLMSENGYHSFAQNSSSCYPSDTFRYN